MFEPLTSDAFIVETYKDGEPADGEQTAEEAAAHAADAREDESAEVAKPDESEAEVEDVVAKDDESAPAKPAKQTAAERIGDITAKMRAAERRADSVQAELNAIKNNVAPLTQVQPVASGGDVAPDPTKFDYGELDSKYIAALARHEATQALKADKAADETARQISAAAATQRETEQKIVALAKAGAKVYDDFEEVVMQGAQNGTWQMSQTLGALLVDSEFGLNIAYELAKNPDEADRVFALSPSQQAAFFGRQEAKFEAAKASQTPKTSKVSQAPPPPKTPRGGSGSNKIEADSSDFAAVETAWRTGGLR